jgi:energy-coupling factor transporter ATP-binding protein EcfA2
MRPIPATRLGHAHGLLRAIDKRGRLRTDEFVTEFSVDELFPLDLENALGRLRHFISYARAAGLVKEDRGVVELTDVGRRYVRAGEADKPFDVTPNQSEWLRRQLREKHMTDSIFHGLAIGLSLLASCPPGMRVSTMDFGRSMAYLGRAGWDNENTLEIQGERHLLLLQEMEMIDGEHRVTPTGELVRGELTLPVHMSLVDIAGQLNPGGPDAVREAAEAEFAQAAPPPPAVESAPPPQPDDGEENGYHTVGGIGAVEPASEDDEPSRPPIVPRAAAPSYPADAPPVTPEHAASSAPPPVAPSPPLAEPPRESPEPVYPPPVDGAASPPPVSPAPPAQGPPGPVEAAAPSGLPAVSSQPVASSAPPLVSPGEPTVVTPAKHPVPPGQAGVSAPPPAAPATTAFVEAWAIRAAAEAAGLRLADGVYANVAAALGAGKHVILTGAPGAGKTTLALAITRAAAHAGRARGATVVTAAPARGLILEAAATGRWVIADEFNQADPDETLSALSTLLGGVPVTLDAGEVEPAAGWRIIATWNGHPPRANVLRRFAVITLTAPSMTDLRALLHQSDPIAAEAVEKLLAIGARVGTGVLVDAARHIAARQAAVPTDADTLADEAFATYIAPLADIEQ